MIRIHFVSDLHLERNPPFDIEWPECDVLILAGDIDHGMRALPLCIQRARYCSVLYVLGNHEFHGETRESLRGRWRAAAAQVPNLYLLDDSWVSLHGVRFVGSTLWSDMSGMKPEQRDDFTKIRDGDPISLSVQHYDSVEWLAGTLHRKFDGKTVVVTHFLPSRECIAPRYERDPRNAAFTSHVCHPLIRLADLWLHGHTHSTILKMIEGTPVLCNPRGLLLEDGTWENARFDPHMILEV